MEYTPNTVWTNLNNIIDLSNLILKSIFILEIPFTYLSLKPSLYTDSKIVQQCIQEKNCKVQIHGMDICR